jgi:glutathione S-transferase
MPLLRIHDYAASANCYKARLLLAQLGLPYERVPVDIFAGESTTPAYRAKNPAGRTPVLELHSGQTIAESNAILLYLGEGTPFVPEDLLERARVWQWLFFEQNLFEPNVGTARFWRLTGRDTERPEVFAARLESARAALAVLDDGLRDRAFLLGDRYTVADVSLYAYAHVAGEAGIDMAAYPAVTEWLGRVELTVGFVNDLEPYPPNARASAGADSVHG